MRKFLCILLWLSITYNHANSVHILEEKSLLFQAQLLKDKLHSTLNFWAQPYMKPNHRSVLKSNSVWFDAYPDSMITEKNERLIEFLSRPVLWNIFKEIGISAIHTGPIKLAGGYVNNQHTPSVDGGFDPISLNISSEYGSNALYQSLVKTASLHHGVIIDDLIPGHTGLGPDFYLALKKYKDYPDIYTLIEIAKRDWPLLPIIPDKDPSKNLTVEQVDSLIQKNYLPGHPERILFMQPGSEKATAWDATPIITGIDGGKRRFVYLHYFKPGQPTINWLSFSFAAQRIISGQILQTLQVLGAKGLRLDAVPFLGIEAQGSAHKIAHSEGTTLAINTTTLIAQLIRKLGGWSYQELNMPIKIIKEFMENGPEFSYDYITHPGIEHAVLTADARLLNTSLQLMLAHGIDSSRLVHGLQNHDEFNYELTEFDKNPTQKYRFGKVWLTGEQIKQIVKEQMRKYALTKPYNIASGNGLCTTLAGLVASRFQINNPYHLSPSEIEQIKQGMLLVLVFNAMQPGILSLSGWDLVGDLPLNETALKGKLKDGDNRWFNRGSYTLLPIKEEKVNLPKAAHLFPDLINQLQDQHSFVAIIKRYLDLRKRLQVAEGHLVGLIAPNNSNTILVTQLPNKKQYLLAAFNFSNDAIKINLHRYLPPFKSLTNLLTNHNAPNTFRLNGYDYMLLLATKA